MAWLFELSQDGDGAFPDLTGMLHEPCWMPAVTLPGKAYCND
jgi:hypothetical protein